MVRSINIHSLLLGLGKIRNNRKQVSTIITPALLVVIEYPDNIIRQNVDGFVKWTEPYRVQQQQVEEQRSIPESLLPFSGRSNSIYIRHSAGKAAKHSEHRVSCVVRRNLLFTSKLGYRIFAGVVSSSLPPFRHIDIHMGSCQRPK